MHPAPRTHVPKGAIVTDAAKDTSKAEEEVDGTRSHDGPPHEALRRVATQEQLPRKKANSVDLSGSPKATFIMRRTSGASNLGDRGYVTRRVDTPEMREHLKHLGPSNLASRPRTTRYNTVKIKTGVFSTADSPLKDVKTPPKNIVSGNTADEGGIGEGLIQAGGKDAKDGVHAVQVGYGSIEHPKSLENADSSNEATFDQRVSSKKPALEHTVSESSIRTTSTIGSLPKSEDRNAGTAVVTRSARSGSITENVVETGGIKKVILETTSSSSEEGQNAEGRHADENSVPQESRASKKKRRKKRKKAGQSESTPLLDGHS